MQGKIVERRRRSLRDRNSGKKKSREKKIDYKSGTIKGSRQTLKKRKRGNKNLPQA